MNEPRLRTYMNAHQLLTIEEVAIILSIDKRTCWRLVRQAEAGICKFPKPLRISARTVRWRASDITAYIDSLAEQPKDKSRN